jgi:antitoxin (DNA-binding transcriptional repressor) of toxin-antitoxin stability system
MTSIPSGAWSVVVGLRDEDRAIGGRVDAHRLVELGNGRRAAVSGEARRARGSRVLDPSMPRGHPLVVKSTYSVKELQRSTAAVLHAAESGALITVTRNDRAVAHVISTERLGAILETMELLADGTFMRELRRLRAGKQKFASLASLDR